MRRACWFVCSILVLGVTVDLAHSGVMTWDQYTKAYAQDWFKTYLQGVGDGLTMANTAFKVDRSVKPLFCPPDKLVFTRENYSQLFDSHLKSQIIAGRAERYKHIFVEGELLWALRDAFPCTGE